MKHEDLMELASRKLSVYDPETGRGRAARMLVNMPYQIVLGSLPRLVPYHSAEAAANCRARIERLQEWLNGPEAEEAEYRNYLKTASRLRKKEAQLERILFARWKVENSSPQKTGASGDQNEDSAQEGDAQ